MQTACQASFRRVAFPVNKYFPKGLIDQDLRQFTVNPCTKLFLVLALTKQDYSFITVVIADPLRNFSFRRQIGVDLCEPRILCYKLLFDAM